MRSWDGNSSSLTANSDSPTSRAAREAIQDEDRRVAGGRTAESILWDTPKGMFQGRDRMEARLQPTIRNAPSFDLFFSCLREPAGRYDQ